MIYQQSIFFSAALMGLYGVACLAYETVKHEKLMNKISSLVVIILSGVAMSLMYGYMK